MTYADYGDVLEVVVVVVGCHCDWSLLIVYSLVRNGEMGRLRFGTSSERKEDGGPPYMPTCLKRRSQAVLHP